MFQVWRWSAAPPPRPGSAIAERITWVHADVLTWDAAGQHFDLVNAQYLHFTRAKAEVYQRLANMQPGGTLLVVGHHPGDMQRLAGGRRVHMEGFLFGADGIAAVLDGSYGAS